MCISVLPAYMYVQHEHATELRRQLQITFDWSIWLWHHVIVEKWVWVLCKKQLVLLTLLTAESIQPLVFLVSKVVAVNI